MNNGENIMEFLVQLAQLIGAVALVATLVTVIIYTIKTSAMAKATKAMADVENRNIELQERPIVSIVVNDPEPIPTAVEMSDQLIIKHLHPFNFPTLIKNGGDTHAKVRIKATVIFKKKEMTLPVGGLYQGKRNWEIQAGTGIVGHLDFKNLFLQNAVEIQTKEKAKEKLLYFDGRELLVRLESKVIYFYKPDSDFDLTLSKNPPVYFRWKGDFAINAYGSWIPEYDVDDFDSIPEMS